jgi:hypothetical protein
MALIVKIALQDFKRAKWSRGVRAVTVGLQDLSPTKPGLKDLSAKYNPDSFSVPIKDLLVIGDVAFIDLR